MSDMEAAGSQPIWFLNRGVLVVRARQPFVDWACSVDGSLPVLASQAAASVNSFLIPEFGTEDESWDWIHENCEIVFELMLHEWFADPDTWPIDRSWEAFERWFDFECIDIAWDLVDEPLTSDPPPMDIDDGNWDA